MGEVYQATDTTLGRDVAIKVLPEGVAADSERLARFRREAKLLASLNHPNIAAIYGLEEADGTLFIALELVEGEDLKERLRHGPIPVDEAIDIATQVAEALEDAHNRGIVHRDLKPANVKLSTSGRVKVLDFGLAKAWSGDASGPSSAPVVSQSPTLMRTETLAGVILGTAAYMAPEQARGKVVDKRADVWAFGVLFWEMLTGRSMFVGETATDVIAAVVTREPDLDALPAGTPPIVRRLIARCLRKDPRHRLPDIGAARLELQELKSGSSESLAPVAAIAQAPQRSMHRERLVWLVVLLATGAVAAGLAWARVRDISSPPASVSFSDAAPDGWTIATVFDWPAVSPDGRRIVFRAVEDKNASNPSHTVLWIRALDSPTARPLPGTEGAVNPAWSPDGASLAFFVGKELRRYSVADSLSQRIGLAPNTEFGGMSWSPSGTILFSASGDIGRIYAIPATGGEATLLSAPDTKRGERFRHGPQFLPDGDRFLMLVHGPHDGVYVSSVSKPAELRRVADPYRSVYAAGYLFFARDGALYAEPFDESRAEVTGPAVALASGVASWSDDPKTGWFWASAAGTLAYYSGAPIGTNMQLAWVDRKGGVVARIGDPAKLSQVSLAPDARRALVEIVNGDSSIDLWMMDLARGVLSPITTSAGSERDAVWAPDGQSIAFIARQGKDWSLRRKGLRASDPEAVIAHAPGDEFIPEFWTRDGRTLLTVRRNPESDQQDGIWSLPLGGGAPEKVASGVHIDESQLSPDGRWLAYVSRESGRDEVYLEPFKRPGERLRVSPRGGGQPKWSADGRELFFVTDSQQLASVTVRAQGERVELSLPTELFHLDVYLGAPFDDYAVGPDGQRFLVKLPPDAAQKTRLVVMTNWPSLFRSPK
jgi:serine/threonine protein kinase/dipeptidyl aminopeptidase/acylaminoacyl peptidase